VEDWNRMLSDRQRIAAVTSQRAQAAEDEASAKYLREAGDFALLMGFVGAGAKVGGGLAQGFGPGGSFRLGGSASGAKD
jgi:hypothetical protein